MGAFSPEVLDKMNGIMDAAIARGSITAEEQAQLLELVDLENEAATIEADALEESAAALEEFAKETDAALAQYEQDMAEMEKEFLAELEKVTPEAAAE